jgi:hypothetical protein
VVQASSSKLFAISLPRFTLFVSACLDRIDRCSTGRPAFSSSS